MTIWNSNDIVDIKVKIHKKLSSLMTKQIIIFWLSILCYPVLLLCGVITIVLAFCFKFDFGMCNLFFLFFTIIYLAVMEKIIPYDIKWHPTSQEWLRDGIYLLFTLVGGGMALAVVFHMASFVATANLFLPLWFEVIIAILLSSLGSYLFHRLSHTTRWLWRLHGIHHVEGKVNVGNNGLNHILDVFFRRIIAMLPLVLFGFSQSTIFIIGIFNTVQGYFVHANIAVNLGVFNYVLVSPEQHRLHHSKDLSEAGHFSVDIALWDLIFGSFVWHTDRKPHSIGVVDATKFHSPNNIIASMLWPYRTKNHINNNEQ
jgi:sterol desaturase/sphingolipid hydroxylase (fatty acid hydroxylase superfamily)